MGPQASDTVYSALAHGAAETWELFSTNLSMLGRLATGQATPWAVAWPIGMARASGVITKQAIDAAPGNPADQIAGADHHAGHAGRRVLGRNWDS